VTPASLAVSAYTNFELLLAHGPVGDQLQIAQLNPAARVTPHSHRCVLVVCHPAVRRHLRFLRVSYENVRGGLLRAVVSMEQFRASFFVESPDISVISMRYVRAASPPIRAQTPELLTEGPMATMPCSINTVAAVGMAARSVFLVLHLFFMASSHK
jgi:hypothetical protein